MPFMFTSISTSFSSSKEMSMKDNLSIACKLDGTLLISKSHFPYFMLVTFEAGSPLRALLLLLISPLLWFLEKIYMENLSLRLMIFICLAGLRMTDIKSVAKAVLPRFYLENIQAKAYKILSSCQGKKYFLSLIPRVMVEPFLREYLNSDIVIGTELKTVGRYCLGLVAQPGLMVGISQYESLRKVLGDDKNIDIGLGNGHDVHNSFMFLCQEEYIVSVEVNPSCLPRKDYPKPLIFHDGRLVATPTPLDSLAIFLWIPIGIILAISRIMIGLLIPYKYNFMIAAATGLIIRGKFPQVESNTCQTHVPHSYRTCESGDPGCYGASYTLYVCSHRTLLDPVMISTILQRPVTAVTYSLSRMSEILSPIRTVRLSRDRVKDGEKMTKLLMKGEVVVCPEGTTCREPYLLRFSPLFSEIADSIVPVAVSAKASMFYGTTVRGYKCLDSFFFLMNPNPYYHLEFLEKITVVRTGDSKARSSYEIANDVQKKIGRALGFECTNLTRRDKYRLLAGNNGVSSSS